MRSKKEEREQKAFDNLVNKYQEYKKEEDRTRLSRENRHHKRYELRIRIAIISQKCIICSDDGFVPAYLRTDLIAELVSADQVLNRGGPFRDKAGFQLNCYRPYLSVFVDIVFIRIPEP